MPMPDHKIDKNWLFKLETNIRKLMFLWICILSVMVICLFIIIIFLFPLKEKEPYLLFFSNADQNFVRVEKANGDYKNQKALIYSLVAAYVQNRETINRINDVARYEDVRLQSSSEVWDQLEKLVMQKGSVYQNNSIKRNIEIINVSLVAKNIAQVDFLTKTYYANTLQSTKRRRATLAYLFEDQEITFNNIPKNPTGFKVIGYEITEVYIPQEDKNEISSTKKGREK